MLMIPNEDETAVHGCHGRGDMVMRKCEVLAIPQSWYMCFSTEEGYFGHALFHIIINRDQVEVNRLSQSIIYGPTLEKIGEENQEMRITQFASCAALKLALSAQMAHGQLADG